MTDDADRTVLHVTGGAAGLGVGPGSSVTPLRMPGAVPPETHQAALDRLAEAMIMTSTIKRVAADSYRMMLRVAITAAPYGEQGAAVEKILQQLLKRLDAHLATVPNAPLPPPGAA